MKYLENECNEGEVNISEENCMKAHMKNHKNDTGRIFQYDINEKRAKKKLLKGAKREENLDIEIKPTCVNMRFSDGAYQEVVMPLLREWSRNVGKSINLFGHEIEIVEFNSGLDIKAKHIDTKIVVLANNIRFVIHVYNGTQNFMVQGKNFAVFATKQLQPFFEKEIEKHKVRIDKFNENVIDVLGKTKMMQYQDKPFGCPNCKVKSSTVADLRKHMKTSHKIKTKNTKILNEDTSILDDSLDKSNCIILEEDSTPIPVIPENSCGWLNCDFESTDKGVLAKHVDAEHVPFLRKKYLAQNFQDKEHIEDETASSENHKISIHEQSNSITVKEGEHDVTFICESVYICGSCARGFEDERRCIEHMNNDHGNIQSYECKDCNIVADGSINLEWHIGTEHGLQETAAQNVRVNVPESVVCPICQLQSKNNETLKKHIKSIHENEKIQKHNSLDRITVQLEETFSKCQYCEKVFVDKSSLEAHVKSVHEIEPFPCEVCRLVLANFTLLKEHMSQVHTSLQGCRYCSFTSTSKDDFETHLVENHGDNIILHSMATEVHVLREKFGELETLSEKLANTMKSVLDSQNEIKQELFLLRNIQASQSNQKTRTDENSRTQIPRHSSPLISSPPTRSRPQPPSKSKPRRTQQKTLFVGDSVSGNVRFDVLEKATNTKVIAVKAYSSIHDIVSNVAKSAPRYPDANFSSVIAEKVEDDEYDNLVVQAGSVDITNLKTDIEPSKHSQYFQQEAVMSARNLFSACENAASVNPNLQKIIILKQTPRYDPLSVDPCSLKPVLSQLYNSTLEQCLLTSRHKSKIYLGTHSIDCKGAIREARYRETKSGKFDGVHLYGSSGQKAYTNSVVQILKSAGMVVPEFDHSNCAQSRYQARKSKNVQNNHWQNDIDTRRAESGKEDMPQLDRRYEIPTQNRFSGLSENYQGNY